MVPGTLGWENIHKVLPSPGILLSSPCCSTALLREGALGTSGTWLQPPLPQEVYPELSCPHQALLPFYSFFSEALLYAAS